MLTMGGNQVKVFQSLIRTNTNSFVVRSHWRLCWSTEASYSCELTSWHRKMNWKYSFLWMDRAALQQWSSTVPRTALSISWCSVAHFTQGPVNPRLQKKTGQWNLANVVWNWWTIYLFPQIKFFVPRDLLANPIFDVCVTEKCLSNLPSPELIKHQNVNDTWSSMILVHDTVSYTSIIHLPFHNSTPMSSLNPQPSPILLMINSISLKNFFSRRMILSVWNHVDLMVSLLSSATFLITFFLLFIRTTSECSSTQLITRHRLL